MRDREIIAVCSEINKKHISGTVWAEIEYLNLVVHVATTWL
jgi:hypothetical protein